MGFGYLLLGYLVTYGIYITLSSIGWGSLALMGGSLLMFAGLKSLCRYNKSFDIAKWLTIALFALGLCRLWQDVSAKFLWENTFAVVLTNIITWASFAITLVFHLAMLYAIRMLALEVGLAKLSSHAMYNTMAVGIWGALFLLCNMPGFGETLLPYLSFSLGLFNLVYLISDIVLLLRCSKNICAAGDEEVPAKPLPFAWLDRINNLYNQTMDKYKQNSRADGEAIRQRHIEKKQQKNNKSKKKKKK